MSLPVHNESTPLVGLQFAGSDDVQRNIRVEPKQPTNGVTKNCLLALFLTAACIMSIYVLNIESGGKISEFEYEELARAEKFISSLEKDKEASSPYTKVQTLSFQIYTGGAPAFITDESTGKKRKNPECKGLHSFGKPEDKEELQCYIGLEDAAEGVQRRLNIMADAVNKAYDESVKDSSTLKIFLAPEFYFRGLNGAFKFLSEEEADAEDACSDICHILKGLENLVADKRFEDWIFLFGTVIASETLPKEDEFDYQFYNFAPLYKGFDPAKSDGKVGKKFIVPKRYVSNIDFLTPLRDLTIEKNVLQLFDEENLDMNRTLMNPHERGVHRYAHDAWAKYKGDLESLGYNMIQYSWFFMDGISFSVEICLDHMVHRALMTYMADIVTGSKTRVPSSANDSIEWVGIPKNQAQISLVSSAGMEVTVASLALANGGHIFLQDGVTGDLETRTTYGQDKCKPNEYEYFGGSQSVKREAVVSATDVTFEYEMNLNFKDYELYPEDGPRKWQDVLEGVFSRTKYQPRLTVYDPVNVAV